MAAVQPEVQIAVAWPSGRARASPRPAPPRQGARIQPPVGRTRERPAV